MSENNLRSGAAYIRVSTDKQEELSPDAQKRLLFDYAKKNNILISEEDVFMENGISGREAKKRPAFQQMIARAKSQEHPFDVILVWKYSRFARNQEESIVYKSMLKKDNVDVISISEPMIDGPFGTLIERIIEWMDEYYSIRLSGEVMRGMTEKAMRGGYQSIAPFGYITIGNGQPPELHPEQAPIVQKIYSDYLKGKTYNALSRDLNTLGIKSTQGNPLEPRTIKYILENPFYCGKIRWNYTKRGRELKDSSEWIIVQGAHKAIISESDWNTVQDMIKASNRPYKRRDVATCKHWLSGTLKCSTCGSSLGYNKNPRSPFFQCWKYTKGVCQESHSIISKKVEENVIKGLEASALSGELQYRIIQPVSNESFDELELLRDQLNKIAIKEKRVQDAYESEIDTLEEYKSNKLRLREERLSIEKKISDITAANTTLNNPKEKLLHNLESAIHVLKDADADYEEKGTALRSVVDKIVYDKKTEHLDFYFYL